MKHLIPVAVALALGPGGACSEGRTEMSPTIEEVKARHTDSLMALPSVVSVGIGLNAAGDPAIVVGLEAQNPETQAKIPEQLQGHPVEVRIVGPIRAR